MNMTDSVRFCNEKNLLQRKAQVVAWIRALLSDNSLENGELFDARGLVALHRVVAFLREGVIPEKETEAPSRDKLFAYAIQVCQFAETLRIDKVEQPAFF